MRATILATRIRIDEKLLIDAFSRQGTDHEIVDLRNAIFPIGSGKSCVDFVVNRSIGQTEGLSAVEYYESLGAPTVNPSSVISCCGNKATMSLAFAKAGLNTPRTVVCYSALSALEAADTLGYPVVLKPVVGSWGRMVVRLDSREAAASVFAYKDSLPSLHHKIYYLQEYIEKPGRDIRIIVIGGKVAAGYYRYSDNWVTNVHLGATGRPAEMSEEMVKLAVGAAEAVGGGALSIDLMEDHSGRLLVNEVNHTMEFAEATKTTGVDVAGLYAAYCVERAER